MYKEGIHIDASRLRESLEGLADLARSRRFDMEAAQALCEISENVIVR